MPRPADQRHDRGTSAVPHAGDLAVAGAIPATFGSTPAISEGGSSTIFSSSAKLAVPAQGSVDQSRDVVAADGPIGSGGLVAPIVTLAAAPAVMTVPAPIAESPSPAAHSTMIAPFVPIPHGAGSTDTVAMGQGASTPLADLAAPAQTASDAAPTVAVMPAAAIDIAALEAVRTSVATLQDSLAALAERLPNAIESVQPTLDAAEALVTQALGGVEAQVGETIASVTATVDATTDRIADGIGDALASVGTMTATLTAPVLDQVVAATGAVPNVADLAEAVVQPVTALLDEGFGGTDPASGITTLVGMVSAADAFGLHDAATGDGEALTPALGALGAADLLADVAPIDALLGVSEHHETHGLADLDGLFGHG